MKTSYRLNCVMFRLRKIMRVALGVLGLLLFVIGSADNKNAVLCGFFCILGVVMIVLSFALSCDGIYTADGVKIRRIR